MTELQQEVAIEAKKQYGKPVCLDEFKKGRSLDSDKKIEEVGFVRAVDLIVQDSKHWDTIEIKKQIKWKNSKVSGAGLKKLEKIVQDAQKKWDESEEIMNKAIVVTVPGSKWEENYGLTDDLMNFIIDLNDHLYNKKILKNELQFVTVDPGLIGLPVEGDKAALCFNAL